MAEKHEGDIPENNKNQESFSKPDEPFKDWYDRVYGSKKKDEESKDTKKEPEEQKEKLEKEIVDKGSRQKDDIFRTFLNFISLPDQNRETLQYALGLLKEQYSKKEITKEQFQNLKVLIEKRLELGKANKKIEEMNKNYAKRFGGFMPSKEWQEIPPDGIPIPPGGNIEMNMSTGKNKVRWNDPYEGMPAKEKEEMGKLLKGKQRLEEELNLQEALKKESPKKKEKTKETSRKESGKDKDKIKEEPAQGRKAQGETFKDKGEKESAYQKLIREIRRLEGVKLGLTPSKNKAEKEKAERQLESLEKKRKEYQQRAQGMRIYQEIDEKIKIIREMSSRGKMFFDALNRESKDEFKLDVTPPELKGLDQEYYHQEILKIIGEKLAPKEPEEQKKILREYLKALRSGRLNPELITNNPLWIEMTSLVPYFHPEVQEEFKARFEIFRYTLGFRDADGVEGGVAGSSRVHMSHIGKALEVSEIGRAYDLIEENSQITKEEIMIRKNLSEKDAEEELKNENPLCMGAKKRNEAVLENLSLKLAKTFGEKTDGLNKDEREELVEKYMWAVEEANDIWRITFRSDESDIGMEGKGGQWYLNRLFHFPARLKNKGFGYEATRKYFNKPFLPVWVEGEPILPVLKGEKLEISEADINMLREKFNAKGLTEEEIEKRIRMIEGMSLEGRGLMMKGLWKYQIDNYLKIAGLKKLKFKEEGTVKFTKDGNGRELPYMTYKREFVSSSGKKKEMVVRVSVNREGEYANVIDIENPSAEILSEICQEVPEGFYGSYVGDWIFKAENTRKLLESGILKIPPGSEGDMERLLSDLRSKGLFNHLDPLSKDKERKPGKYYQEDAWEDFLRGAVDFGLHEGRHMFERWHMWGAWNAGVLIKKATDLKVITDDQGRKIENEMLTFLGMRGNIPRWLRCNFDRFTMFYRWGPGRKMILLEMLKEFFEGILPELPSAPKRK